MAPRLALRREIAEAILDLPADAIVRVAISGVDGAGKTTMICSLQ